MPKQHLIKLKKKDRKVLWQLVNKGQEKARVITRSRILLLADDGKKDGEITDALRISLNTVRQVRQRYDEEGMEAAIRDRARSGAPLKFSGKQKAQITALACSN